MIEAPKALAQAEIEIQKAFKGHSKAVRKTLACFLAGGHVLIEDRPGVGKTLLAQAVARALGLDFKRLQMTPDLMPSDVTGGLIWIPQPGRYEFRAGPLFSTVVLLDELNRASSKTQSAVLQAMEEKRVSVDGRDYPLPELFFLMATQNPHEEIGVNRLPSSQLDRFALKLQLGSISREDEKEVLRGGSRDERLAKIEAFGRAEDWLLHRGRSAQIQVSEAVLEYLLRLAEFLRQNKKKNISTRAVQSLLELSRAWAYLAGRDHVLPEDVQELMPEAWAHRLSTGSTTERMQDVQEALASARVL